MGKDYDAKAGYTSKEMAVKYDSSRFKCVGGYLSDLLDKLAVKRAIAGVPKDGKVLDLPCGTGRMVPVLESMGYKNLTLADISEEMIAVAKGKYPDKKLEYVLCEAEKTPFADDEFEAVILVRFFFHIPPESRIAILREMGRICRGRIIGEFVVNSPTAAGLKSTLRFFSVSRKLPKKWGFYKDDSDGLHAQASDAGLRILHEVHKLRGASESVFLVMAKKP